MYTNSVEILPSGNVFIQGTINGNGSGITNINGDNITDGTIDSTEIEDNTIGASDLAADSV